MDGDPLGKFFLGKFDSWLEVWSGTIKNNITMNNTNESKKIQGTLTLKKRDGGSSFPVALKGPAGLWLQVGLETLQLGKQLVAGGPRQTATLVAHKWFLHGGGNPYTHALGFGGGKQRSS